MLPEVQGPTQKQAQSIMLYLHGRNILLSNKLCNIICSKQCVLFITVVT